MHALWLVLALAPAEAAPAPAIAPVPVSAPAAPAPAPAVAPALVAPEPAAQPAPAVAPVPDDAPPAGPSSSPGASAASPSPSADAAAPPAAAAPSPPPLAPPLPQAAVEKLGQGDRAFLDRDYRNALFAYQDAVYLAPKSPVARVKLGRAYLALRYAARAVEQAELAMAADPSSPDARRLLEDAKTPAVAPPPAPAPAAPAPAHAPVVAAALPAAQPRVYRFTPEPDAAAQPSPPAAAAAPAHPAVAAAEPAAGPMAGAPREPAAAAPRRDPAPVEASRTVAVGAAMLEPAAAPAPGRSAGQRYRDALAQLAAREYAKADETLTDAIAIDPRLAVAHAARASARFGLGRFREAATDYRTALELDPGLATPLYGLAECYRVLGDAGSAAEMYDRYARSGGADVREDLRGIAAKRAQELR